MMFSQLQLVSPCQSIVNSTTHNLRTYKLHDVDTVDKRMTSRGIVIAAPNLQAAIAAKANTRAIVTFQGYTRFVGGFNSAGDLILHNDADVDTGEGSPSYDYLADVFQITKL